MSEFHNDPSGWADEVNARYERFAKIHERAEVMLAAMDEANVSRLVQYSYSILLMHIVETSLGCIEKDLQPWNLKGPSDPGNEHRAAAASMAASALKASREAMAYFINMHLDKDDA